MAGREAPRYLGRAAFDRALPIPRAIAAMEAVFRAEAGGDARASERQALVEPLEGGRRALLLTMPAAWHGRALVTKVVGFIADNPAFGRPAVQGVAVLIDAATGSPRLIADAAAVTSRRTAAMVGAAASRLAPEAAHVLGLVGTGALADDMIAAIRHVRPIECVVAYNRSAERAHALAARTTLDVDVVESADAAARAADVLVVATSSTRPVVSDRAIRPGTHVAAVGCFSPDGRELEGATVGRAEVWVDGIEGAMAEAGDLLLASREGQLGPLPGAIRGDLAALVSRGREAGCDAAEITLFKSVGTAVADLGALVAAEEAAFELGLGIALD